MNEFTIFLQRILWGEMHKKTVLTITITALFLSGFLAGCSDDSEEKSRQVRADQEALEVSKAESAKTTDYVLAINWQPAFCESSPRKRACKTQKKGRYDTTHFSLHGLWPQPGTNVYCDVPKEQVSLDKQGQWRQLRVEQINDYVWRDLQQIMPGTMSGLHKHEWVKHGTCYSLSIDDYYSHSVWLVRRINASKLQDLFESRIGLEVTSDEIKAAFSQSFGPAAGERLRISCRRDPDSNRTLISEITVGLSGKINGEKSFADLVNAASAVTAGCPRGIVDPVGLQNLENLQNIQKPDKK
ncbi:MAG: ribonuclease [Hyphomicrobiales bacterium]|nr:MAG: ribonuclease [Hyphomicrobiales bacterium]